MNVTEVKKLSMKEALVYWIRERQQIAMKKKAGLPKPWTDDVIFQTCWFTNVRRKDDKTTQWLLTEWYPQAEGDVKKLIAGAAFARTFNLPDTLKALGYPHEWDPDRAYDILQQRASIGMTNFSGAYQISGNHMTPNKLRTSKLEQTVRLVFDPFFKCLDTWEVIDTTSMRSLWSRFLSYRGFDSFISGQFVADLRLALPDEGNWKDKHRWAPVGPGSSRGICRYMAMPIVEKMIQNEFNDMFLKVMEDLSKVRMLPEMEAMDVQNVLCEYDKYQRVLLGGGDIRRRYHGMGLFKEDNVKTRPNIDLLMGRERKKSRGRKSKEELKEMMLAEIQKLHAFMQQLNEEGDDPNDIEPSPDEQ